MIVVDEFNEEDWLLNFYNRVDKDVKLPLFKKADKIKGNDYIYYQNVFNVINYKSGIFIVYKSLESTLLLEYDKGYKELLNNISQFTFEEFLLASKVHILSLLVDSNIVFVNLDTILFLKEQVEFYLDNLISNFEIEFYTGIPYFLEEVKEDVVNNVV